MIKRNVLIADDGQTAVLMDFGSMCQARIHIENRQEALAQQVNSKISYNKFDGKNNLFQRRISLQNTVLCLIEHRSYLM
jgi:hypothetical protein